MKLKYKPKFKIDDIVCFKNYFSHNPADNGLTIGKITSIHIFGSDGILKKHSEGDIMYNVTGVAEKKEEQHLHYCSYDGEL